MAELTQAQLNEMVETLANVAKAFKYTPYIYRETPLSANTNPLIHYVKFKEALLDEKGILFFIPSTFSDGNEGFVQIGFLYPGEGYNITNNVKYYNVKIEQGTQYVSLKAKQFYTNRLYMLRKLNDQDLIVINYRADANVVFETAEVSTLEIPSGGDILVDDGSNVRSIQTLIEDIDELKQSVAELKTLIKVGTGAPEDELANEPAGTIYIKVEDL